MHNLFKGVFVRVAIFRDEKYLHLYITEAIVWARLLNNKSDNQCWDFLRMVSEKCAYDIFNGGGRRGRGMGTG
jgi:hypothetical protein